MELTRQRLLETILDMQADGSDEVTVATVAERAKVSVRTAYRYFPTKEAMFDAFNDWMVKQWGSPPLPTSVDELTGMAAKLLESFERNEKMVRAGRRGEIANETRKRRKAEQVKAIMRVVGKHSPHYDETQLKKLTLLFLNVLGSDAWLMGRDNLGLTTAEITEAVQWGLDALLQKIESERPRKGRK